MENQSNTPSDNQPSVQDIIRTIEQKSEGDSYIYRGEPERHEGAPYHGKVSSSLWRKYQIEEGYFDVELVQKELLVTAKKHTGNLPEDFRLDLIDALKVGEKSEAAAVFTDVTELRQFGGETNLIDFTTDYCIALFCACDGQPNEDGRVILEKADNGIKRMIQHSPNPRPRGIAEKSVLIKPLRGFIEPRKDRIVIVPKHLKQEILEHLRAYRGISTETIYNGLHGFTKNQDILADAYTAFYKGFACHHRADVATTSEVREHKYEKAIGHYTEATELKPNFAKAYGNRGVAYGNKGKFDAAIRDFDKAIDLKPQYANAYSNRGVVWLHLREWEKATADLTDAKNMGADIVAAFHRNHGSVEDFEAKTGIQLPAGIVALVTSQ